MVEYFWGRVFEGIWEYCVNTKFPYMPTSFRDKNTREVNKTSSGLGYLLHKLPGKMRRSCAFGFLKHRLGGKPALKGRGCHGTWHGSSVGPRPRWTPEARPARATRPNPRYTSTDWTVWAWLFVAVPWYCNRGRSSRLKTKLNRTNWSEAVLLLYQTCYLEYSIIGARNTSATKCMSATSYPMDLGRLVWFSGQDWIWCEMLMPIGPWTFLHLWHMVHQIHSLSPSP
jgi:hypothetical protein